MGRVVCVLGRVVCVLGRVGVGVRDGWVEGCLRGGQGGPVSRAQKVVLDFVEAWGHD